MFLRLVSGVIPAYRRDLINKFTKEAIMNLRFHSLSQKNAKIGTHDGVFHCDDVLACFMIKQLPEYADASIIRTRNMTILNKCDIVVDVGAVFDHANKRYDHHQVDFKETLSTLRPELGDGYKIKLSSAGLIYAYYGEEIIKQVVPIENQPIIPTDLRIIYKKIYEKFIQEIDAIDNGVPMTTEEPRYQIQTNLSSRVARLNPDWNSKHKSDIAACFDEAMYMAGDEFTYMVTYYVSVWLPARALVRAAVEARYEVHQSGQILEFSERFPWQEHLFDVEAELSMGDEVKYVIFMDKPDSWRVQAIPIHPGSFVTRKPLLRYWWGIRDEVLSTVARIEGCMFCHSTGFIAGNNTRYGALKMAVASLEAESF